MSAAPSPGSHLMARISSVWLFATALCLFTQGCATRAARVDEAAREFGFRKLHLSGSGFVHAAYFKPTGGGTVLHVYIEHDGTPWRHPTTPSADPTPEDPLALAMMSQDPAPSLYLGRPCYFGAAAQPPCEPVWWTHRRFSREVVDSMAAALGQFLRAHPDFDTLHLFGYSGGGVLATLLSAEFSLTRRLVTVAAPLDLDGWTRLHGYSPMTGSLDPARQPPLPATVHQLHFSGADDRVVPGNLIKPFVEMQPVAQYVEIPGFDHRCCWAKSWRTLILGP